MFIFDLFKLFWIVIHLHILYPRLSPIIGEIIIIFLEAHLVNIDKSAPVNNDEITTKQG